MGTSNAVVRARIDPQIKEEASAVLAAMGLTVSDAFRLLLTRVAQEKALPFEPLVPNETTIAAMREARAGHLKGFDPEPTRGHHSARHSRHEKGAKIGPFHGLFRSWSPARVVAP